MAQFQFILWLAYWYHQNEKFECEWDSGNSTKSVIKHAVTREEVEFLFEMRLGVPLGRQLEPKVDEQRLCIVGPSHKGRIISVVFTLRDGKVRPISSRSASRKERLLHEKVRQTFEGV